MSNETYNSYLDAEGLALVLSGIRDKINAAAKGITNTKGKANGIASLDAGGNVPLSQLGNLDTTFFEIVTELPTDIRNIKSISTFSRIARMVRTTNMQNTSTQAT